MSKPCIVATNIDDRIRAVIDLCEKQKLKPFVLCGINSLLSWRIAFELADLPNEGVFNTLSIRYSCDTFGGRISTEDHNITTLDTGVDGILFVIDDVTANDWLYAQRNVKKILTTLFTYIIDKHANFRIMGGEKDRCLGLLYEIHTMMRPAGVDTYMYWTAHLLRKYGINPVCDDTDRHISERDIFVKQASDLVSHAPIRIECEGKPMHVIVAADDSTYAMVNAAYPPKKSCYSVDPSKLERLKIGVFVGLINHLLEHGNLPSMPYTVGKIVLLLKDRDGLAESIKSAIKTNVIEHCGKIDSLVRFARDPDCRLMIIVMKRWDYSFRNQIKNLHSIGNITIVTCVSNAEPVLSCMNTLFVSVGDVSHTDELNKHLHDTYPRIFVSIPSVFPLNSN